MGKAPNGLGKFSGKVGGVVFAVSNGEQIVRAYQPVVSNPKSSLQTMQRSKGNLAGRISSFTPRTAIMGLGTTNRQRRGEFLRNILKKATVTQTAGGYKAKIDNPDLIFSKGSVISSVVSPSVSAAGNTIAVTLYGASTSAIPADEYASMQTRLVGMVYDSTTQELVEVVTIMATKPDQGGSAVTNLLTARPAGYAFDVYAIPMSTADGSAVSIDAGLALKDDNTIAAALSVNDNAVIFKYGKSNLIASGQFTPAP